MPAAWLTGNQRVLCLGDSHTYGLWVERSQAYPQQLEAVWNERGLSPKLEVVNVGVPGTNSSRVLRELPEMLETLDPDILIVMVGGNDFWTLPVPLDERAAAGELPEAALAALPALLPVPARAGGRAPEVILDPNAKIGGEGRHKIRVGDREIEMGFAAGQSEPGRRPRAV